MGGDALGLRSQGVPNPYYFFGGNKWILFVSAVTRRVDIFTTLVPAYITKKEKLVWVTYIVVARNSSSVILYTIK